MKRRSPIIIAGLLALVALIFSVPAVLIKDVYREWAASHKALYQYIEPVDSVSFRFNGLVNLIDARLFSNSDPGLSPVHIFVAEQRLRALQNDLPRSVKKWQRGKMLYPDGTLQNVQVRHRGDNPFNWLYLKKSWRLKTRKERMLGNVRAFNLIAPQDPVFIDTHFYLRLAQNCGLLASDSRLVELFLNGKTLGVHTEIARLDENFLRNNQIMPVNLYKGEQRMSERRFGLEFDLYSGPALWSKVALNNYTLDPAAPDSPTDMSDLSYILRTTQEAIADEKAFKRLRNIVDWDYWAKFAAYEILAQHSYDGLHNNRLIADIWRGQVKPIPVDPQATRISSPKKVKLHQFGSRHGILDRLERAPAFRMATVQKLAELLRSGCLEKTTGEMQALLPGLLASLSRDPAVYQTLGKRSYWAFDPEAEIRSFLKGHEMVARELARRLSEPAPINWSAEPGKLQIISGSLVPQGAWIASVEPQGDLPADLEVWWDRDGDDAISANDVRLPISIVEGVLHINAGFAGNFRRQSSVPEMRIENYGSMPDIQPATFRLLFSRNDIEITRLAVKTSSGTIGQSRAHSTSFSPNALNHPVFFEDKPPEPFVYSGLVSVEDMTIVDRPVKVMAGTVFQMSEGASIIFRGRTVMSGTPEDPIRFEPATKNKRWGVVGLQGSGANRSILRHVKFKGGTGASVGLTRFIAMLSVHNTTDILLDSLELTDNAVEDDMLHVIYSDNVTIRNIRMTGAMADAIDIDISTVTMVGGHIEGSGNDAIDLMSSDVTIRDVRLVGNGDKGVSIGEASQVKISGVNLLANDIGVQSKDGSIAVIERSQFDHNRIQLSAFQKNWRYGGGGRIGVSDASFIAANGAGAFSADPQSRIDLGNSTLSGPAQVEGIVIRDGRPIPQSQRWTP